MSEPKRYACANGALLDVPVYDKRANGSNWMAVIDIDPAKPGGLSRRWIDRGRGECFYLTEKFDVFDAVEFGADFVADGEKKRVRRWYGVVVAKTDEYVAIEVTTGGKDAVLLARAKRMTPAAVIAAMRAKRDALAAKLAEIDRAIADLEGVGALPETFEAYAQRLVASL